ncbi:uncharacterized protein LOC127240159 isoform X2 [Andrographis paniculata]|uniref:uncharacterized protein LOC127240159 isoform X2 n=1 Tax=Andrographis paniculata TaxID=175694 RepID=UPI0021E6FAE6|nr:uncharacterized protein LOC127240159 isoform X2 [Andrographis paniculata]
MRDIIKEYTDEIKQAVGIADISKTEEMTESMASDDLNAQANASGVSRSRGKSRIPETNRDKSLDYWSNHSSRHYSEGLKDEIMVPRQDLSSYYLHKDFNAKGKINDQDGKTNKNILRERMHGRDKHEYTEAREGSPQRSIQKKKQITRASVTITNTEISVSDIIIKVKEKTMPQVLIKERAGKIIESMGKQGEEMQMLLVRTDKKTEK